MTDVLIVGAGPTGLLLAGELRRFGVTVRLVEKLAAPSPLSRAIALHARTLEVLEELGVAERFVQAGVRYRRARLFAGPSSGSVGEPIVETSFDELDTAYPFALGLPQDVTERLLTELLATRGGQVERGVELVELTQDARGCRATLSQGEVVECAWVVGCDGAHSKVRKALGLTFAGETNPERFWLADVKAAWDLPRDGITSFFGPDGVLACFPLPDDRWRLIFSLGPATDGEPRDPTLAEVEGLASARAGRAAGLSDPAWLGAFRINTRQVAAYRVGRAFVAGDAAHIHSPVGGQGMNTGLQDAHALAWRLALVVRNHVSGAAAPGGAADRLLDSWSSERHAIGAAMLRATALATTVGTLRAPLARAVRDRVAGFLASLEPVQQRLVRSVAELDLTYRRSELVAEHQEPLLEARVGAAEAGEDPSVGSWLAFRAAPRAGDRALDARVEDKHGKPVQLRSLFGRGRHLLLLFDGRATTIEGDARLTQVARDAASLFGAAVEVVIVTSRPRGASLTRACPVLYDPEGEAEARYGATTECGYLVRPDLHVGFRCQPVRGDLIVEHLATRVGLATREGLAARPTGAP